MMALQLGCYTKSSYPPLGNITEITVYDQSQILKRMEDPVQITEIIRFIDSHRHGWYTPIQGTPIPKIKLLFYSNGEFRGSFGVGEDFFQTQREGRFDAKPATNDEIENFLNLVGVEKKRLFRKFGEKDPDLP
ncbi:MAG: hypothetical protein L0287_25980 [Anaerolineae bacterium]|nr:hypothetical protein [Anaerolineae bacterium]